MRLRDIAIATITFIATLTSSCSTPEVTSGVAYDLATQRKSVIRELHYDLHFSIPKTKEESVAGELLLSFHLDQRCDVILDFRDLELLREVTLEDGTPVDYICKSEHIILSRSDMQLGKNSLRLRFYCGNQSLNRNEEYLYTLLVPDRARTLFPCFDQPDMKATYTLRLTLPEEWTAVSNTSITASHEGDEGYHVVEFAPTEPLSTYLFSFVAGELQSTTYDDGTHRFTAYYRETDPKRIAQLDTIFSEVKYSIEWLEEYTGVKYPFAKYDFIMLPGFQYGGMEHTGATLYNASQMFLSDNPTLDELLRRSSVIAHETAHMWFGDYVTMRWFDDVWTKEVFANYFAARIVEPLYPTINHRLNRLKSYTIASLAEDRTPGSNAIRQELDNLQNAGLIYGHIIYNKAPIVMDKLVEIMGDEAYRKGIHQYLTTFGYGNATWPELIEILDGYTDADLRTFSEVWVHSNSMPTIESLGNDNQLIITQYDPLQRGLNWPQSFTLRVLYDDNTTQDIDVTLEGSTQTITLDKKISHIIPNVCGRGYGLFELSDDNIAWLLSALPTLEDELAREATLINLHELYRGGYINDNQWIEHLTKAFLREDNYLIASTMCDYLQEPLTRLNNHAIEEQLWSETTTYPIVSLRRKLLTTLAHATTSPVVTRAIYDVWQANGATWLSDNNTFTPLSESDAMTLSYELAIRLAELQPEIIATQRARINNPDRQREYDYISRGTASDIGVRDELFIALLNPAERRTEPWALALLRLLNHHTRQDEAFIYIRRGLEELTEIQRTGDIFFPTNWCRALLSGHHSDNARMAVLSFLNENPDYSPLLRSKILQALDY